VLGRNGINIEMISQGMFDLFPGWCRGRTVVKGRGDGF
jgi:hypothetical protein